MAMIIARRIPSPLAGAADCGPNQQWDPNYAMPGLPPGQCTPKGSPMTPAPGFFDAFMSKIFPKPVTVAPMTVPMVAAPPPGMSQNTMLALGALGLLAVVLVATRK